jgi:hypothetical protein
MRVSMAPVFAGDVNITCGGTGSLGRQPGP